MFEYTHRDTHTFRNLLIGLGVGGALGIFFAPKSGKETRRFLIRRAEKTGRFAQHTARDMRERAEDFVERGVKVAAKTAFVFGALRAGRHAYRRVKSMAA